MLSTVSQSSESLRREQTFDYIQSASKSLADIFASSFGPKGTFKMLVSGAGDIRLTKDGNVLIKDMSIIHPAAAFIAKSVTGQAENCGDGTIMTVLFISGLLHKAESYIEDGVHPNVICSGLHKCMKHIVGALDGIKVTKSVDSETLSCLASNICSTKLPGEMASSLASICSEAVISACKGDHLDLTMIEMITLKSGSIADTKLIRGLVLDHGGRHPNMPKKLEKVGILLLNVSLEYEKTEINSSIMYKTAEQRESLAVSERKFVEDKASRIVEFLSSNSQFSSFLVINQKGIEPFALDIFAKHGILALRRAKRRNMERIMRLCGGNLCNSVDELSSEVLGSTGLVYERAYGDEKFTFIEQTPLNASCAILITGPSDYSVKLLQDTAKACIKALGNFHKTPEIVPGAGSSYLCIAKKLSTIKPGSFDERVGLDICGAAFQSLFKTLLINSGIAKSSISDLAEVRVDFFMLICL